MTSGVLAAVLAGVCLGFVEAFGHIYPAHNAWRRLRRIRGREAVRRMRERFADASERRTARFLALGLVVLLGVWIASAPALDKRWYEVALDALPSAVVGIALLRVPVALRSVAERMKVYEQEAGDDPDGRAEDGPTAIAL